jgi:hypothetical protein
MNNNSHDTSARKLRVFLCHASEDKPVVRDIYQKLVNHNMEPWLDEKNLLPGEHWEQLIPDIIRKCDIIILCLSRTFQVKEGYGQYEVHVILEAAKRKPQDTIFLIPFRLDDCEVPSYLNGIHYASHFIPEDFDKLISACKKRREWLNTIHGMNIEPIRKKASQATLHPSRSVSEQTPPQPVPPDKDTRGTNSPGSVVSAYGTLDQTIKVEHFNFTTSLNPVNVFLSYVHEDEELLRQLEAHLSMLKREGLIATWCDRQIMPGADWAGVIDQHLEQASLILLLVSADFLASDYSYQIEVKRALELHQAGKAVVIPLIMRPTDWKNTPFAQLQALPTGAKAITDWSNQDNAFVDIVTGIREVVEKLASLSPDAPAGAESLTESGSPVSPLVDGREPGEENRPILQEDTIGQGPDGASLFGPEKAKPVDRHHTVSFGAPFPELWNVPRRHNAFFTGRASVLQQLADGFQIEKGQGTILPQAITGLAGMGKTQTAAEYAYLFREKYQAVLWVHAQRKENLILDFRTLAGLLKLPQEHLEDSTVLIQTVQKWFRSEKDWLLIFDNADDFALVAPFIPVGLGHILLTTRVGATVELAQPIELQELRVEDGALCLLRRAGLLRSYQSLADASSAHADAARELALQMKGLPLALEQAGAYINDTKCGVIKYREHYKHYRARLQNMRPGMVPDYAMPVAPALMMSSLMIGRTSMAFALLQLCAFLAPEGIPDAFVVLAAPVLGELLSPVADDPILLDQAISSLVRYSLLEREEQSGTAFTMLSIHRIMQLVLLDEMEMDRPTLQLWAERAVRALLLTRQTELWPILQAHVQQCLEHIAHWNLSVPEAEEL